MGQMGSDWYNHWDGHSLYYRKWQSCNTYMYIRSTKIISPEPPFFSWPEKQDVFRFLDVNLEHLHSKDHVCNSVQRFVHLWNYTNTKAYTCTLYYWTIIKLRLYDVRRIEEVLFKLHKMSWVVFCWYIILVNMRAFTKQQFLHRGLTCRVNTRWTPLTSWPRGVVVVTFLHEAGLLCCLQFITTKNKINKWFHLQHPYPVDEQASPRVDG